MRYATLMIMGLATFAAGCTTTKSTNTARTAKEQMLVSGAVDQALDKVNFSPFQGYAVLLDEKYVDCVDKAYLIGSVRHRVLAAGGHLVDKPEEADIIVELRSGAVGTDNAESFIGIPEIALPGMITLPEVRFLTRSNQTGMAKIGLVAYDAHSHGVLGIGGTSLAHSDDNNWYVVGVGPFQEGSLKREVSRSTTGNAAIYQGTLPSTVSFATPTVGTDEPEIRFTSGEGAE